MTIGDALANNLRATRERRRLGVRAMSERLAELGHPVLPSGISKAEYAEPGKRRRLWADELVAMALALDTSPAFLLSPPELEVVNVTEKVSARGWFVGSWVRGEEPLVPNGASEADADQLDRHFLEDAPEKHRRRARIRQHPAAGVLDTLRTFVDEAIDPQGGTPDREILARALRDEVARVVKYVDLLADEVERQGK